MATSRAHYITILSILLSDWLLHGGGTCRNEVTKTVPKFSEKTKDRQDSGKMFFDKNCKIYISGSLAEFLGQLPEKNWKLTEKH